MILLGEELKEEIRKIEIDTGWLDVQYKNGWSNLTPTKPVQYRKIGKTVYISGACKAGDGSASHQEIFTLPAGFRPKGTYLSTIQRSSDGTCRIHINYLDPESGVVAFEGDITKASEVSLFNISFIADY